MAKYKVDITGINTSSLKVLSQEEQIELFKRYQNGDMLAKEELVNGNLKLVCKRFWRHTQEAEEAPLLRV